MERTRIREILLVVAIVGMVALAGCSGQSGGADADDEDDEAEPDDEAAPSDDGNSTDSDEDSPVTEETRQPSGQQVTARLQVVSATGNVDAEGDSLSSVNVTVKLSPGSDDVNLAETTVSWVESGGTYALVPSGVEGSTADGHYGIDPLKDADGSSPVLNDPGDRLMMTFDVGEDTVATDDGPNGDSFGSNLDGGQLVTFKIVTESGGTTTSRLVVPQSLSGVEAVNL